MALTLFVIAVVGFVFALRDLLRHGRGRQQNWGGR
jgi:hypothetical protein